MGRERAILAEDLDDAGGKVSLGDEAAGVHGFVAGPSDTDRSRTLRVLAECFSLLGVPVIVLGPTGSMSGIVRGAGSRQNSADEEAPDPESRFSRGFPAAFYDLSGRNGISLRTTVTEFGPMLMPQVLSLKPSQAEVLRLMYRIADDMGLLLIDTRDLKAMLNYAAAESDELEEDYGRVTKTMAAAVIRSIVRLESFGGDSFFGEPAIDVRDLMPVSPEGLGVVSMADTSGTEGAPEISASFIMYLLSEIQEALPGGYACESPAPVIICRDCETFFKGLSDEMRAALPGLLGKLSDKGAGVYFEARSACDIPEDVAALLTNQIFLAHGSYTQQEQRALRKSAGLMRSTSVKEASALLGELAPGEAAVSISGKGQVPGPAGKVRLKAPLSLEGAITAEEISAVSAADPNFLKYRDMTDRDSCWEFMQRRKKQLADEQSALEEEKNRQAAAEADRKEADRLKREEEREARRLKREEEKASRELARSEAKAIKEQEKAAKQEKKEEEAASKSMKRAAKSVLSTTAGTVGREVGKNIGSSLGGDFGKTLGGNVGASLGRNILGTLFKT